MKSFYRDFGGTTVAAVCALLIGCADNDSGSVERGDHVWKAQTDALDKARQVEQVLHNAARERRERLDKNQ